MKTLFLLLLIHTAAFASAHRATGAEVVELVFTSLYSDRDDERLAKQLESLKMTEQLSNDVVTYFERLGLGQESLAALQGMAQKSMALKPPPQSPLAVQPAPAGDESRQMLENLFQYARRYVHDLPNFLCEQVTKRYTNLDGFGSDRNPRYRKKLHHGDTMTMNLSFVNGSDQGQLTQYPVKKLNVMDPRTGQSISIGEFGGDMAMIFGPEIDPELKWDHWEVFRGKRTPVFSYFVGLLKSQFRLLYCCFFKPGFGEVQQTYRSAIGGLVYVDAESGVISRLMIKAQNLPSDFRIDESYTIIDYGNVSIAGRGYTLPLDAIVFARSDMQENRNEISFLKYRKFDPDSVLTSVDSKITYKLEKP